MIDVKMAGVRHLTESEIAMVAGGNRLSGFIKDSIKAGLAAIGGAAFGPAGAIVGFIVGSANGLSVDDGAKYQGQFSGESGWMPTTANF
ncbi:MAG TPA: hypothetical protein VFN27_06820 [Xanthobacteraceae bacterium]|nr:hypothetical protein [Xanthobacteraceae bacterium]